jgi:hypothetical protein
MVLHAPLRSRNATLLPKSNRPSSLWINCWMERFISPKNPLYHSIEQDGSTSRDSIPMDTRAAPRSHGEHGLQPGEDGYPKDLQNSYTSDSTATQKTPGGGTMVILGSLAVIVLPMLGLAALLLSLVLANKLDRQQTGTASPTTLGPYPDFNDNAYYVDFNPTTLVTIASWSSTVAPLLAVCAMVLISFPLAHSFKRKSEDFSGDLPTSFQFSLLLDCLGAGISPLWKAVSYRKFILHDVRLRKSLGQTST